MAKEFHINEDTSKPENRVNLNLFHLMMLDEVKAFVFEKLKIPYTSTVYPSPNLTTEEFDVSGRPDFQIENSGNTIGYVEVELGSADEKQLAVYRKQPLPVYSIIGKRSYGDCDLSLEEIYLFLSGIKGKYVATQSYRSIQLLIELIKYHVMEGNSYNSKPNALSDKMKESKLIKSFFHYFGQERIIENGQVQRGKIMLNTRGENGFSLRIYSTETGSEGLSMMYRTAGRPTIYFPPFVKLKKYLPDNLNEVNEYCNLIALLGAKEIFRVDENRKCSLEINKIEDNIDRICKIIDRIISG